MSEENVWSSFVMSVFLSVFDCVVLYGSSLRDDCEWRAMLVNQHHDDLAPHDECSGDRGQSRVRSLARVPRGGDARAHHCRARAISGILSTADGGPSSRGLHRPIA
jgi:hypothetical protein